MTDEHDALIAEIRETLDDGQLSDVANYGATAGFPGFTYYSDTRAFYARHEAAIWDMLSEDADDFGVTVLEMIAGFNGAAHVTTAGEFENLLTWYALEAVARLVTKDDEDDA